MKRIKKLTIYEDEVTNGGAGLGGKDGYCPLQLFAVALGVKKDGFGYLPIENVDRKYGYETASIVNAFETQFGNRRVSWKLRVTKAFADQGVKLTILKTRGKK